MFDGELQQNIERGRKKDAGDKKRLLSEKEEMSEKNNLIADDANEIAKTEKEIDEIIREYEPDIERIAKRILSKNGRKNYFSLNELIQAGRKGVWKAIEGFDSKKANGGGFNTFAYYKINGAILDYIREEMPISRDDMDKIKKYKRVEHELMLALGREPTIVEIAKKMNINEDKLFEIVQAFYRLAPQTLYFKNDSNQENDEYLNPNVSSIKSNYEKIIDKKKLKKIIKEVQRFLTKRQRKVLIECFLKERAQNEVAKELKMSESGISQMIKAIKTKLKKNGRGTFLEQYHKDY